MRFKWLLVLVVPLLLAACPALTVFSGKNIMLEPFTDVQSIRLGSSKNITLSQEQKNAIVIEMNQRFKSPWHQYFGKISSPCLVLTVNDNGRTRSFHIYQNARIEASTGGHGGAVSTAQTAPDSILKKLYDQSEKCN